MEAREQAVEEWRVAAELRKQNEQAMAKQVLIRLWNTVCLSCTFFSSTTKQSIEQNGLEPKTLRQQNIITYPTLNIAQSPSLMAKMAINSGAVLEIWNPRTKTWDIEDVNHCMNIKGVPELLVRFLGVEDCPGFEWIIGEDTVTVNKRKRLFDGSSDGDYMDSPSYRRTTLSETSQTQPSCQSSIPTCPLTPSTMSLSFSVPSSPLFSDMITRSYQLLFGRVRGLIREGILLL